MPRIVFRVDAGSHIGSGHVMRCLSLASALTALGARCRFICRAHDGHLGALIEAASFGLHLLPKGDPQRQGWLGTAWSVDADETLQAIGDGAADWLVVDHYAIDARWERRVAAAAGRCLVIDDLADRAHAADLLLDQNLQPAPHRYDALLPAGSRSLLGPRYALLRQEFAQRRAQPRTTQARGLTRLLAFAGGMDSTDLLGKACRAWRAWPGPTRPHLDLVVGPHSPNLAVLRAFADGEPQCHLHVQTSEMARLIGAADLMVTAGGTVNWERCCLGVPALVCETAPNQHDNVHELARARTAIGLGPSGQLTVEGLRTWFERLAARPTLLARLADRAARQVDGRGARRVAVAMLASGLVVRRAVAEDAARAWPWRNAESTRRYFHDPRPVPWPAHQAWWQAALDDGHRQLLIAQVGSEPVGVLRFDTHDVPDAPHAPDTQGTDPGSAMVSIYIDPDLTGLRLGAVLLEQGRQWIRQARPQTRRLVAEVHADNRASQAIFAAAGYVLRQGRWVLELHMGSV